MPAIAKREGEGCVCVCVCVLVRVGSCCFVEIQLVLLALHHFITHRHAAEFFLMSLYSDPSFSRCLSRSFDLLALDRKLATCSMAQTGPNKVSVSCAKCEERRDV